MRRFCWATLYANVFFVYFLNLTIFATQTKGQT